MLTTEIRSGHACTGQYHKKNGPWAYGRCDVTRCSPSQTCGFRGEACTRLLSGSSGGRRVTVFEQPLIQGHLIQKLSYTWHCPQEVIQWLNELQWMPKLCSCCTVHVLIGSSEEHGCECWHGDAYEMLNHCFGLWKHAHPCSFLIVPVKKSKHSAFCTVQSSTCFVSKNAARSQKRRATCLPHCMQYSRACIQSAQFNMIDNTASAVSSSEKNIWNPSSALFPLKAWTAVLLKSHWHEQRNISEFPMHGFASLAQWCWNILHHMFLEALRKSYRIGSLSHHIPWKLKWWSFGFSLVAETCLAGKSKRGQRQQLD